MLHPDAPYYGCTTLRNGWKCPVLVFCLLALLPWRWRCRQVSPKPAPVTEARLAAVEAFVFGSSFHPHSAVGTADAAQHDAEPALAIRRDLARRRSSGAPSGFMSGLMGGLIGAGIGGMLFGHGFMGGGMGGFGFLGLLLQIFLLVVAVRFLYRMFPRAAPPPPPAGRHLCPGRHAGPGPMQGNAGPSGPPPLAISPDDYQQFEQLLQGIQAAWSAHDLNGLRPWPRPRWSATSPNSSPNRSAAACATCHRRPLVSGDLAQAWTEQGRDYATVAMRFSMIDVTRDAAGRVVDGSATEHVTATEIWTFVRSRGGHWILSAIQQAR